MPTFPSRWTHFLFLALVTVLPLHTVFVRVGIALKPWLILLGLLVVVDLLTGRGPTWPQRAVLGAGVFLIATLVSWPGDLAASGFWRLWFALVAGVLLMVTVGVHGDRLDDVLRVVFWTGAAMGVTALVVVLFTNGLFGEWGVEAINELPLVDRVNKAAYLDSSFVALTNWHQDPGYSGLWTNVWLVLSTFAWTRGVVRAPNWVGPAVLGGLATATLMTYSRTAWFGLVVAVFGVLIVHWREDGLDLGRASKTLAYSALVSVTLLSGLFALDDAGIGGDITVALDFRFSSLTEFAFVSEPAFGDSDVAIQDNRRDVWREYAGRFSDNPVRGIGLGTGWAESGLQEPHNMWLQLMAETGLVGLTGFLVMLFTLGRPRGPEISTVLSVLLVASLTQTVLFESILWFTLGLWLASSHRVERPLTSGETIDQTHQEQTPKRR